MKISKLRKGLGLISFLLFPITIYYLSPYLIIQGAAEGIVVGSFIIFVSMFILSMFFGRLFCGWACPAGGLQDCCMLAQDKRAKGARLNLIKYMLWVPWILSIATVILRFGGLKKVDFLYQTYYGISVSHPGAYIIYYGVIILITVFAFTAGRRSFCHYICWMAPFMIIGRKIGNSLRLPSIHLKVERENCIKCSQCSKKCPMSLNVQQMVENGIMENSECILCGECTQICPKKVIHF